MSWQVEAEIWNGARGEYLRTRFLESFVFENVSKSSKTDVITDIALLTTKNEVMDGRFEKFCEKLSMRSVSNSVNPAQLTFWLVTPVALEEEIRKSVTAQNLPFPLRFFTCSLSDEEDVYIQGDTNEKICAGAIPEFGYRSGPNLMFYMTMMHLSQQMGTSHVLLLETDCFFVKDNWLDSLNNLCTSESFWVAGSSYKGLVELASNIFCHLNGVAVYNIGNDSFVQFLREVLIPYQRHVAQKMPWLAYDCATEVFTKSLQAADAKYKNLNSQRVNLQLRLLNSMFLQTNLIANISTSQDSVISSTVLQNWFPKTVLVHQK